MDTDRLHISFYQWGYDDKTTLDSTILAGEGDQNYYNPNPDLTDRRYWVMTNYHGCLQKSYYSEPTGLNQIKDHDPDISLYPNPANDDLYISVKSAGNTDTFDCILSDVWSKHKMEQTLMNEKTALNISKLSPGVYVLVLYNNGTKVAYRTIVKE